jgi:hypothetical protein
MFFRSWLTLVTAMPRAASRVFWCRDADLGGDVLGVLAEQGHAGGDPAHRADQQQMQRDVDQRRRDQRDRERQRQDPFAEGEHRLAQRRLVDHHLDARGRLVRRLADHPDLPVARPGQAGEGIGDQLQRPRPAQVEAGVDLARGALHQHQLARVRPAQRDRLRADVPQQLALQLLGDHLVGRRLQGEHRQMRACQLLLQIGQAVARHRRHEDQHLRQHDEKDRQHQQARGQALGGRGEGQARSCHRSRV